MHRRRGRDHRILQELVGLTMHQPRPAAEGATVHVEDIVGARDLRQPSLDLRRLGEVVLACFLDAPLDFAKRHGAKVQIGIFDAMQPS